MSETPSEFILRTATFGALSPDPPLNDQDELGILRNEIWRLETIILSVNTGEVTDIVKEADAIVQRRTRERAERNKEN